MNRKRLSGYPTSSNRASSFHLHWLPHVELAEVSANLAVSAAPTVGDLYFWALQASFAGPGGITGGGHIGLQWHSSYPGRGAINWGGYHRTGGELEGSESSLSSTLGNANTRDFPWSIGHQYRLKIFPDGRSGWWAGEVTDVDTGTGTVVRSLNGGGDRLVLPIVWSEVFARCDAPPSAVIWSAPAGIRIDGSSWEPDSYSVTYQTEQDGGCSNSDVVLLPHGVGQFTGVTRATPHGSVIPTSQL